MFEQAVKNKKELLKNYKITNIQDSLYEVILNVCDRCNRKCTFCPRGNNYLQTGKDIDLNVVEKVCKDLGKSWHGLFSLSGFGEPSLNKDLTKIIEILKENTSAKIMLITNGDYYEYIKDLIIDVIEISCYDEKRYLDIKQKTFKSKVFFKKQYEKGFTWFNNRAGNVPTNNVGGNTCFICMMKMFVDVNGDILQCCSDWKREHILGNVLNSNVYELWENAYKQDRLNLLKHNRNKCILCRKCDALGDIYGKEFSEFWSSWYSK